MSDNFLIAETEAFQKQITSVPFKSFYARIKAFAYPQLRQNPFFGINIKKLKGEFSELHRYRLGRHRLFYRIDQRKALVFILAIKDRKDAY